MKKLAAFLFFLSLGVCPCAFAHGKVFGLLELRSAVLGTDEAQWRNVAYSDVPADASQATTDLYYEAMYLAAFKLGDLGRAETLVKLWEQANTGSIRPRAIRFQLLARSTGVQLEEAAVLGEEQVTRADKQEPDFRILARNELASLYLSVGEYGKAETLLSQAELIVRNDLSRSGRAGRWAFVIDYATTRYLSTRCVQQIHLYQYKKAEAFCLQAISVNEEAIKNRRMGNPYAASIVTPNQIENYATLAKIYINTNRYYDAEIAIKKANERPSNASVPSFARDWITGATVELTIAKKDISELRKLNDAFTNTSHVSESSIGYVGIRKQQQTALVATERWQAAQIAFDESDAIVANGDIYIKQAARHIIPRSLTYLMNARAAQALPLLEAELKKLASNIGEEHAQTGLLRGLYAVALISSNPAQEGIALAELDRAVSTLTSSASLAGDYFNQADHPIARRMIFEKYIELAGKSADARYSGRALGIADSLRSSGVQQAMNDAAVRAAASTPQLAELVRRDQDAKNELQSLYNFISNRAGEVEAKRLESVVGQMKIRIAELEKSRAQLDAEITKQFAEYKKLTNPQPPTLSDIAAKLAPNEALLTLLPTEKSVYVWAVSVDGANKINQQFAKVDIDKTQLASVVKRLRGSLDVAALPTSRRPPFDHAAAQTLYQSLLVPVQSALQGKTSLVVAAGGVLGQIPFGVLQTQVGGNPNNTVNLKDAPWLIKQAAITHVPSVAAWLSMRSLPHRTAEQALMGWGDPLFNLANAGKDKAATAHEVRQVTITRASTAVNLERENPRSALRYADIPTLPETRDELFAIAKTLGGDAGKDLMLGAQATRESVLVANKSGQLGKQRVIAFATHGLMAGDLPNLTQPALAMTSTKDADTNVLAPLLTLEDVLGLKLNADWVVLSACNTAAADGKAEEALSGLARGFFYAGGRSLLVTHWAVDSDSAVTLTTETFKHYQNNPTAPKAESLRQAMLTVLNNPSTAHPTYWAPYALVGDGAR